MKAKIIIIVLLLISITIAVVYSILPKEQMIDSKTQDTEIENEVNEVVDEIKEDEQFPEVILTSGNEEIEDNLIQVDDDEDDRENSQPALTDEDLKNIDESEYITIGDDDRITLNEDGSISIQIVDDDNNRTELIYD